MPLISVVIPTYNRWDALQRALRSVAAVDCPPGYAVEVVVVDDGSTDRTGEIAGELAEELSPHPTRMVRLPHSGRPGAVRNAGVAQSGGEWIAFLDSDDEWLPHKLRLQCATIAAHPAARLIHTRERWLRHGREVSQSSQRHRHAGDIFPDALHKCIIGPSTAMIRRDAWEEYGGFHPTLEIAEDYELWLRITAAEPVQYVAEPCIIKHGGHPDQLSAKYDQIEGFRIAALAPLVHSHAFAAYDARAPWHERTAPASHLARAQLRAKYLRYAAGAAKRDRPAEADRYRTLALQLDRDMMP